MMLSPLWWVLLVMFGGGIFGGIANYFLALEPQPPKPDARRVAAPADSDPPAAVVAPSLIRSLVVGVAAAALVPLFLNTLSSNILVNILNPMSNEEARRSLLIFGGFCVLAAISSTTFIRTLSDRVLRMEVKAARQEAKSANAKASHAEGEVERLVTTQTEPDERTLEAAADARFQRSPSAERSPKDRLLGVLAGGRWSFRTLAGLAKETQLDPAEVSSHLKILEEQGLVARTTTPRGERWYITAEGRAQVD